mmetsp:Transcript_28785/g.30949  ORF Transcript_28785/g.30949 Transcript_28785/m.30949 type:complete len:542 (-) Transcript_28785:285-1910(-)
MHNEVVMIDKMYKVEDIEGNKRTALAGQWQTPPHMPSFPSAPSILAHQQGQAHQPPMPQSTQQQQQQQQHVPHTTMSDPALMSSLPSPINLPDNSEEYAKALQEAYRKGAQAAARMAQQQQHQQQIPTAASCPNFSTGSGSQSTRTSTPGIGVSPVEEESKPFNLDHQIVATKTAGASVFPDPLRSSMPPPPPPPSTYPSPAEPFLQYKQQQHHQHQNQHHYIKNESPVTTLQHQSVVPVQYQTHHSNNTNNQLVVAPAPLLLAAATNNSSTMIAAHPSVETLKQSPGRSLSMPDMLNYTAETEEEKRLKRLARNRASARLRRLRKKNLVDAYETEVGVLEKSLNQLQTHEWGKDSDNHKALLDALGMERGQQAISPEQRTSIIQDILKQQMQQVNMLQEAQREQEFLALLASQEENQNDDAEDDNKIFVELQDILQLSTDQKRKLRESSKGLDKEVEALETVSASLQAMQQNDWLLNEGTQKITNQFTSILHKNQQSKLLLWTDANAEAVDQLDHVQVQPLQSAPVFYFGVETISPGDDE